MNEKFTPGPWAINGDKIETTKGGLRARVAIIDDGFGIENPEANADLISAAPDLYAALKEVYDTFWGASKDDRIWTVDMQRFAKEVLAKARGEK